VAGLVLVDVVPNPHPARVRSWLDERGLRLRRAALVDDVLTRGPALRATLAAMDLPVLLVRGGTDSPLTDADIDRVRAANPAMPVVDVPEAGHLVARDAPDQLAAIILDHALAWHRRSMPSPSVGVRP
jgi:pimeloyl-ACP methyl ester carboxylesterase